MQSIHFRFLLLAAPQRFYSMKRMKKTHLRFPTPRVALKVTLIGTLKVIEELFVLLALEHPHEQKN